jgi:hypothetical protein
MDLLEKQLIYKMVMSKKDWNEIRNEIVFDWSQDNYYAELKDAELLRDQAETADALGEYVGKYFSNLYVQKNIFKMSDDEIDEETKQIKKEEGAGEEFVGDDIKDQRQADIDATAPGEGEEEEEPGEEEEPPAKDEEKDEKEPPVKKEEPKPKDEKKPPAKKEDEPKK